MFVYISTNDFITITTALLTPLYKAMIIMYINYIIIMWLKLFGYGGTKKSDSTNIGSPYCDWCSAKCNRVVCMLFGCVCSSEVWLRCLSSGYPISHLRDHQHWGFMLWCWKEQITTMGISLFVHKKPERNPDHPVR